MKQINIIAVVVALVVVGMTAFIFDEAEATYPRKVGTIVATAVPNAGASSNEYVSISFSGIFGKPGYADFSGWHLKADDQSIYDMSEILLHSTDSAKICEDKIADSSCDYTWSGTDLIPDVENTISIVSPEGIEEVIFSYGSPTVGQVLRESGDYVAEVHASKDKVIICQEKQNGVFEAKKIPVNNLVNDFEKGLDSSSSDIIPGFVYETQKTPGYHPGLNWPASKDMLDDGCVR